LAQETFKRIIDEEWESGRWIWGQTEAICDQICYPLSVSQHNKRSSSKRSSVPVHIPQIDLKATMQDSAAAADAEQLESIFCEIRDQLAQPDTEALKRSVRKILDFSKPQTMEILASLIFRESSQGSTITSQDALSIVGFLVTSDSATYLKPASRAVKKEAIRLTTSEHPMMISPELLHVIVSQLSGNDVEVSTNATEAMVACCRKLGPPFADPALRAVTESWRNNLDQLSTDRTRASTVCVRCAAAVVEMSSLDDSTMHSALSCGAFDLLSAMMTDESDPLLQMSVLDLIERLALIKPMHQERARWFFRDSVAQPLLEMAGGDEEGSPDPILGGPALRVIAALCKLGHRDSSLFGLAQTELVRGFHRALHNFEASGELDRLAMVDAISSFASASPDALDLILNDPVTREAWLSLSVAQPKLKSVILASVAMVLDPLSEVDANGDSITTSSAPPSDMAMKLYASIGSTNNTQTTELVLAMAKSPLPETRFGAYTLLSAVAKLGTGGQVLFTHPGFYEWLMNRERETTKEGREAKYAVVESIVGSEVKGLLADEIVRKLQEYLKQGPHYLKPLSWELAVE
jgi:26S proteasome non-ATPase regulatory subunit 5